LCPTAKPASMAAQARTPTPTAALTRVLVALGI
jgi:hypothetical protein